MNENKTNIINWVIRIYGNTFSNLDRTRILEK